MRALLLLLLITLTLPRLGDDSSMHAAVCLRAQTASMDHAHAMHLSMEHHQVQQQNLDGQACQHCGDCGAHIGSALNVSAPLAIVASVTSPVIARDIVHPISRPSTLIRPPLA